MSRLNQVRMLDKSSSTEIEIDLSITWLIALQSLCKASLATVAKYKMPMGKPAIRRRMWIDDPRCRQRNLRLHRVVDRRGAFKLDAYIRGDVV
jgi:hypothetical protein